MKNILHSLVLSMAVGMVCWEFAGCKHTPPPPTEQDAMGVWKNISQKPRLRDLVSLKKTNGQMEEVNGTYVGYAKSIMDYLFRWLELRFLSGKQLPLFAATVITDMNTDTESNQAPDGVSQFHPDSYAAGDAPLCTTCGSLMVRNGSCYKCGNCGGTSGCS